MGIVPGAGYTIVQMSAQRATGLAHLAETANTASLANASRPSLFRERRLMGRPDVLARTQTMMLPWGGNIREIGELGESGKRRGSVPVARQSSLATTDVFPVALGRVCDGFRGGCRELPADVLCRATSRMDTP